MPGFAVGCPQRLAVRQGDSTGPHPTSILGMAADPTGAYIAILTRHDLQIWSGGQHQLLLGWAATDDIGAEEGLDEDEDVYVKPGVVWHRGGREVCILGLDGAVAFFEVTPLEDYQLVEGIDPPEWVDAHPAEGSGVVHYSTGEHGEDEHSAIPDAPHAVEVTFLRRLDLAAGAGDGKAAALQQRATCLSAGLWGQHLLLGRDREPVLMDVSWSGVVQHEYHLGLPPAPGAPTGLSKQGGSEGGAEGEAGQPTILLQACYSDVCHLLAAVLSDGRAVVSNFPSSSFSVQAIPLPPGVQQAQGPEVLGIAETLAFSPLDATLAVGYDDGSVAIFRVASSNSYPRSPSRRPRQQSSLGESSQDGAGGGMGMSTSGPSLARHLHGHDRLGPGDRGMPSIGKGKAGERTLLYPSGEAGDIELILARRLSLASLGFETRHVGAVLTMDFSPDGGSLAVAHAWSALNVWDTAQWCRPMTTFPRVPETPDAPVMAAVPALLWAHRGYRLLVAHNEVKDDEASASILRYEMLRWARHAPLADTSLCLQGASTIAFLEQRPWNPRLLSWARVTVPPAYATPANTPVHLVAVSPSGQHLAVAGQRGLALYSRASRKWRLFGNVQQERELQVAALAWWGEDAVVAVARHKTQFLFKLYPRAHLDNTSLLHEPLALPPGTRPLFLACVKDRPAEGGALFRGQHRRQSAVAAVHHPHRLSSSFSPSASFSEPHSTSTTGSNSSGGGSMDGVYWKDGAVLMVGDGSFLLFYRLARDHSPTGVSLSFICDLPMPLHHTHGTEAAGAAAAVAASEEVEGEDAGLGIPAPTGMGPGEAPKRVVLLPEVRPITVAVLSSTGTLYRVEARTGKMSKVAGNVAGFWELRLPTADPRMRPCYVLYCGEKGFSLWLPSLRERTALSLTWAACHDPFLDPTFNPDVEGVLLGVHNATSSLIFLTQRCLQPPSAPGVAAPPRFEVALQRRPIYQVAFRFLLFLQRMLVAPPPPPPVAASASTGGGIMASLLGTATKHQEQPPSSASSSSAEAQRGEEGAQAVAAVVGDIFDELYSQPETRIQLADALDFLVRSCIEAVASAHARTKTTKQQKAAGESNESYFTSLDTCMEQVRAALELCRREPSGVGLLYEVIARVARKVEPSRLKHLFPLPLPLPLHHHHHQPSGGAGAGAGAGAGDTPVTLFEKCLASRKLHTALLYLPLIDPPAAAPHSALDGSGGDRARLAAARQEYEDLRLVHGLALRLLWECLRRGKREWRMLKQLWRFIEKREEALAVRQEEARALGFTLDSSGGAGREGAGGGGAGGRPILGFLYRYTVGTLVGTGAGADGDGDAGPRPSGAGASAGGSSGPSSASAPSYLAHLPTGGSTATVAGGGGGRGHTGTWTSSIAAEAEIQAEEITPGGAAGAGTAAEGGGLLAGFDLLRHARSGGEVLTLFCSMCLATLRLREMVDALLLLGGQDPSHAPYPSLQPWATRAAAAGNATAKSKWQQHAAASAQWPWARFGETAGEVVLDTFLAIREQFPTASSSSSSSSSSASAGAAAATAATAATAAAGQGRRAKGECSAEERLAVLGRVCVELRDYECLLALGTFLRDERTVAAALKRGKLWPREYRSLFLDERMEAGGAGVKAFVDRCTAAAPARTAAATAATEALAEGEEGERVAVT